MVAHGAPLEPCRGLLAPPGSLLGASWGPLGSLCHEVRIGSGKRDLGLHEKATKTYIYIYVLEASPETWASMEREARSCGCVNDQTDNELSLGEQLSRSFSSELVASASEQSVSEESV